VVQRCEVGRVVLAPAGRRPEGGVVGGEVDSGLGVEVDPSAVPLPLTGARATSRADAGGRPR
jgi:hypothetical protein